MKKLLVLTSLTTFIVVACSGGDSPTSPGGNGGGGGGGGGGGVTPDTVYINGTTFEPANLRITPGRTVVWFNRGSGPHTVTPDGHTAWTAANTSSQGVALRVTFSTTGTFDYFCEPHRSIGMTGRVTVASN